MEPETTAKRAKGRPRKQTFTITVPQGGPADLEEEKAAAAAPASGEEQARMLPLFAGLEHSVGSDAIVSIVVLRTGPVSEGHLGSLDPSATEEEIRRRWGGGEFLLYAKNGKGQTAVNRKVTIGGEPNFMSEAIRAEYDRQLRNVRGLPPSPTPPLAAPAPVTAPSAPAQIVPPPWGPPPPPAPTAQQPPPGAYPPPGYAYPPPGYWPAPPAPVVSPTESMLALLMKHVLEKGSEKEDFYAKIAADAQRRESEERSKILELVTRDAATKQAANDPLATFLKGFEMFRRLNAAKEGGGKDDDSFSSIAAAAVEGIKALPGVFSSFKSAVEAEKAPAGSISVTPATPATLTPSLREQVLEELGKRDDILLLEGDVGRLGNAFVDHFRALGISLAPALRNLFSNLAKMTPEQIVGLGLVEPPAPVIVEAPAPPANGNGAPEAS